MYYEYHLKDGTTEISSTANISSFQRVFSNVFDEEVGDFVTEECDVEVSYCVIKEGNITEHYYLNWD